MSPLIIVLLCVVGIFCFISLLLSVFTVQQQTVKIIERFGKFKKIANAGINIKTPWIDWVAHELDLRIQQLDVKVETKTEDNVFVETLVSVQYYVLPENIYEAAYKLADSKKQITSFVFDVVRARVPKIKLDDVFEKKDEIADAVKNELKSQMDDFGYGILKALVTDIDPDSKVKESMNEINAAQRLRLAANEKGEADKILSVKKAEAEAQSKALQGKGIADQRKAIIDGLKESVETFKKSIEGCTANDVMNLVMMTQYFDTLKDLGVGAHTILVPHSPSSIKDIGSQIREAIAVGEAMIPKEAQKQIKEIKN